jgi:hypothetical protein
MSDESERVTALEAEIKRLVAENARLETENDRLRRIAAEPKGRLRIGLAVPVGLALLAVCAVIWNGLRDCRSVEPPPPSGTGQLVATGPTFGGAWTFEVGGCASGQRSMFFGVDLVAKDDPSRVMRVIEDPVKGTIVKLDVVGASAARFIDPAECSRWDISLSPSSNRINGHVALTCAFSDGGTLAGRLDFTSCN